MGILRDDNKVTCLGQFDGVVCYIKTADYRSFEGKEFKVVTGICFNDLEGNTIYKRNEYNSYICRLESNKDYFNIADIIEDLALYIDKNDLEPYWKNKTIDSILNNNSLGLLALKRFKTEYYNNIEEQIRKEKSEKCAKIIEDIKLNIESIVAEINNYIEMRIFNPCKSNEYKLQFVTKFTMKEFETLSIYNNNEGIKEYESILKWLNDYLYYISNDFDPVEFIEFDVILNNKKVS